LTTLFENVESTELRVVQAAAAKKHGWLPLLTVLFLISYGLMTMLIVEQGQTIESQRALIRDLFRDSTELSAVKMKAHRQQQAAQAQSSLTKNPSSQTPSSQAQSPQAPAKQSPSTQAGSQHRMQTPVPRQKPFPMPSRPASDLMDSARSLISI
jgi:predicted lipid-binding transport protein (Tim44 family)